MNISHNAQQESYIHNASLSGEGYEVPRALWGMKDVERATETQIELFTTDKDAFFTVEKLVKQLPRQRQREYFRKLYLRVYKGVKDDGSIAFACGNKQRRTANLYLRHILGNRLKNVFAQYRINLGELAVFKDSPEWLLSLEGDLQEVQSKKTKTAEDLAFLNEPLSERVHSAFAHYERKQVNQASQPFYLLSDNKLKNLAYDLALAFQGFQRSYVEFRASQFNELGVVVGKSEIDAVFVDLYALCAHTAEAVGFPLKYATAFNKAKAKQHAFQMEKIDADLLRCIDEKYWLRLFRTTQKRMVEHIRIACGEVCKQKHSYVSFSAFMDWQRQCQKNVDFLKSMILQNVDDPEEQVELFGMFLRSDGNPAIRRLEMMNRLRGIEEWAEQEGNEALFLTLTAPSSYHAMLSEGGVNPKWNGANPRQTQAYLNRVWQQYRALLAKRSIGFYGMRVAEAHHDATPHWHLLFYVKSEHKQEVIELFKAKALEEDGDEKGAQKHRCKVEECDKAKGSATAYIAKYISKNINGFGNDGETSDEAPELELKDNARRVRAWASYWGIRQFQFYGGSSISVWRELRRLTQGKVSELDDEQLSLAQAAADEGDYKAYLEVQGGAMAPRKEQPIKLYYETTTPNQYGEVRKQIKGVKNGFTLTQIISRLKKWSKVRKLAEQGEASNLARNARPWTCVSNCNLEQREQLTQDIQNLIKPFHLPLNERQIEQLLSNGRLILNDWQRLEINNNRPRLINDPKPLVFN